MLWGLLDRLVVTHLDEMRSWTSALPNTTRNILHRCFSTHWFQLGLLHIQMMRASMPGRSTMLKDKAMDQLCVFLLQFKVPFQWSILSTTPLSKHCSGEWVQVSDGHLQQLHHRALMKGLSFFFFFGTETWGWAGYWGRMLMISPLCLLQAWLGDIRIVLLMVPILYRPLLKSEVY